MHIGKIIGKVSRFREYYKENTGMATEFRVGLFWGVLLDAKVGHHNANSHLTTKRH